MSNPTTSDEPPATTDGSEAATDESNVATDGRERDDGHHTDDPRRPARRWAVVLAVVAVGVVPWSVQRFTTGELFFRFAWGGVSFDPAFTVAPLWTYPVGVGIPLLTRWAVAAGCWVAAVGSATAGLAGREDRRLTAGLLAVAAAANLLVALSFAVQPARVAYPTGSLVALAVAGWRLSVA